MESARWTTPRLWKKADRGEIGAGGETGTLVSSPASRSTWYRRAGLQTDWTTWSEQVSDDQCTGANHRYPLMSEIKGHVFQKLTTVNNSDSRLGNTFILCVWEAACFVTGSCSLSLPGAHFALRQELCVRSILDNNHMVKMLLLRAKR